METHTIDHNLYSRQIGAYGVEAMGKLITLKVYIHGLRGVHYHFFPSFLTKFSFSLVLKLLRTSFSLDQRELSYKTATLSKLEIWALTSTAKKNMLDMLPELRLATSN